MSREMLLVDRGSMPGGLEPPSGSLARHLAFWFFYTSLLLIIIACAILYWATVQALNWADDQVIEKRMEAVRSLLQEEKPNDALIAHEVSEDNQGPRQIFIRVIADSADLTMETPGMPDALAPSIFPVVSDKSLNELRLGSLESAAGTHYRVLSVRVPLQAKSGPHEAILQVAIDTSLDKPALAWYRKLLASVLAVAILLTSLLSWLIVNRKLSPLRAITTATSQIGALTLDKRIQLSGMPSELQELGSHFNSMLERLEIAYKGLRQYADNIAHELRSPLNKMLLAGEVTLAQERRVEALKEALESNIEECKWLAELVDRLLFLARAENKQTAIERRRLDIIREIEIIRSYFEASANEAGIVLTTSNGNTLEAEVDRQLFQRAVANAVTNAIAHTPRNGLISIRAEERERMLFVVVSDTGCGIPSEDLPFIFDRFYRSNKARSTEGAHMGLGLSIAKSIVELHGGQALIQSEQGRGTTITLSFAKAAEPQSSIGPYGAGLDQDAGRVNLASR